ncbi:MAG: ABC transporter ATP-binding protein [Gemmataceae bacterium]
MTAILRTEKLTKDYGATRALDSLNLTIAPGEIFGLLGPNGSGKSTALRLLLGFLRATSGDAFIEGHHCWRDSVEVRRRVAYLPGELRLYESMTGRQLVKFLAELRGQPLDGDCDRLARQFDIDLSRPLVQLSSGMKRKVALMSVLLPKVPLVILDEPTNTLDPTMRDELLAQLREAKQRGQTILFSSHVLTEVEHVCDRVGILRLGKLVHLQSIAELHHEKTVRMRFHRAPDSWPVLLGVVTPERWGKETSVRQTGPPASLFAWLATQDVEEVHIEPGGLSPVYQHYHGSAE